ncbi:MAG TPA: nuclear transport factor 2 family protein [Casimicrobiaceae bacterium]|jgi:ketosteroid isomerase-like protein
MKDDAISVARACYEAYERKDRPAIEALIADDFHFSSPLDNRLDRKTYFARCWPNSQNIAAFDLIHAVRDGPKVFVIYEARNVDGSRFRNTEVLTIRGHQIAEVEVYFGWSIPHPAPTGGFTNSSV